MAGIGWQLGLLSGLAESRLDVRLDAGLFVGTSAGATVAAQITSGLSWKQLLERFGSPDSVERPMAYDLAERRRFLAEVEAGANDEIDARPGWAGWRWPRGPCRRWTGWRSSRRGYR